MSIDEDRLGLMLVGKVDLNLLKPLEALLEECNVSRAAERCGISQSAMSRTLERLRATFEDELLVRFEGAFTRTARAEELVLELQEILPRLESALRGNRFDPSLSRRTIRVVTTEYGAAVVVPGLVARLRQEAQRMQIETQPWNAKGFENVNGGQADLAIVGLHDTRGLVSEELFVDTFACVVAKDHPMLREPPTLEAYLSYGHVECTVADGRTPIIDSTLEKHGVRRRVVYRTAFTHSGVRVIPGSELILTLPRRLAEMLALLVDVRIMEAPTEFKPFTYATAYHRRMASDAMHAYVRRLIKDVANQL